MSISFSGSFWHQGDFQGVGFPLAVEIGSGENQLGTERLSNRLKLE